MGAEEFHKSLVTVAKAVKKNPQMSEGTVSSIFSRSGFFRDLKYKDFGIDIRSQERARGKGKIPDFECFDDFEQSIFVLELKKPSDEALHPIESYRDKQLKDRYVIPKRSRHGILSNGIKFYLYRRVGERLVEEIKVEDLGEINDQEVETIYRALKKPAYEYTDFEKILAELRKIEPKSLENEDNRNSFYEIFRLKQEESGLPTKFTLLVIRLTDLFDELISNGEKSEFLDGAYKFWKKSYAHKPSKVPESWRKLTMLKGVSEDEELLYKFMFCLETAHNIVSKLILSKVCEDAGFRNVSSLQKLEAYMNLKFGEGRINYIAYPFAVKETFDSLRSYLVESVFEDDIFDWWTDCKIRVGENVNEWRTRGNHNVESFGDALARIFFALRSFDFSNVKEDILGELYQHYFDPETRKALGEFYTPIEVVEYILDAVEYKGQKILNQRLLDPACGSGTFIVEALKRYLREAEKQIERKGDERQWSIKLRDLCERPKIIGFDINPFARLMAQMRFMMEIIPYYLRAQKASPDFVLTTIPIFRTDSLEIETKTGRLQKQLGEFAGDIKFFMRLPIIEKGDGKDDERAFIPVSFSIPTWKKVKKILHGKKDSYFLLLKKSFEAIKDNARKEKFKVDEETLKRKFEVFDEADALAGMMLKYVNPILGQIEILRKEYSDGRLIKTLEDLVLAGVLKNYFTYDYVVGNPPYVRLRQLSATQKDTYRSLYHTAKRMFDLYCLFVERGALWLTSNGKFGFIISNKFMVGEYGFSLREFLENRVTLKHIIDFGDSGVFKDATNYPLILIFDEGNRSIRDNKIKCVQVFQKLAANDREMVKHIKRKIELKTYIDDYIQVFEYPQSSLNSDAWSIKPIEREKIFHSIRRKASYKLKDICDSIQVGYQTGADRIYVVSSELVEKRNLERGLLKKCIAGYDVRRWRIDWRKQFVIFPYLKSYEKTTLIEETTLKEEYPNIYSYLAENRKTLEKRWGANVWYELPTYREIDWFEHPKILIPDISNKNNFAIDDMGYYFSKGLVYGIIPQKIINLQYLIAILNSKILEFYFKHISPFLSGGYYRYKTQYLEKLPIKLPQTKEEQKLADEITDRVEKILSLAKVEQRVENFPEIYFDELSEEIEEWAVIKSMEQEEIDSELKEKYVTEALESNRVKKGKEPAIKLPRSDTMVKRILEKYGRDKERLEEKPISDFEGEINERVYKLYGLDEGDTNVIEEFLEKF